jgi:hypothetical protein
MDGRCIPDEDVAAAAREFAIGGLPAPSFGPDKAMSTFREDPISQ